jgi:hypothetical protein
MRLLSFCFGAKFKLKAARFTHFYFHLNFNDIPEMEYKLENTNFPFIKRTTVPNLQLDWTFYCAGHYGSYLVQRLIGTPYSFEYSGKGRIIF